MKDMRSCEHCIWADQCTGTEVCEHYYDATQSDDIESVADYASDLRERYEYYQELISEQDS